MTQLKTHHDTFQKVIFIKELLFRKEMLNGMERNLCQVYTDNLLVCRIYEEQESSKQMINEKSRL